VSRRQRPAELAYVITSRSDKAPKIGDLFELGKQAFEVVAVRVRVELRPVRDDDDQQEYED